MSGFVMAFRFRIFGVLTALVAGLAFAPLQARAAISTFDIGTITFGGPAITGLVGSGSLTGNFDFDDILNEVVAVDFTVAGSTSANPGGNVDGAYDTLFSFLDTSVPLSGVFDASLTVVRGSEGSSPTGALQISIGRVVAAPAFAFSASVGRCESFGGLGGTTPCRLIVWENTSSAAVAEFQPGYFGTVPLPAPALMLIGALGVFGAMTMRRRTAFA